MLWAGLVGVHFEDMNIIYNLTYGDITMGYIIIRIYYIGTT